jgi:hypothetical protein
VPAAQSEHAEAATGDDLPAAQSVHTDEPSSEYVPAPQSVHADEPVAAAMVPAEQSAQAVDPTAAAIVPAEQGVHAVTPVDDEYVPIWSCSVVVHLIILVRAAVSTKKAEMSAGRAQRGKRRLPTHRRYSFHKCLPHSVDVSLPRRPRTHRLHS